MRKYFKKMLLAAALCMTMSTIVNAKEALDKKEQPPCTYTVHTTCGDWTVWTADCTWPNIIEGALAAQEWCDANP